MKYLTINWTEGQRGQQYFVPGHEVLHHHTTGTGKSKGRHTYDKEHDKCDKCDMCPSRALCPFRDGWLGSHPNICPTIAGLWGPVVRVPEGLEVGQRL